MYQWKDIQSLLRVKAVIDQLKAVEQAASLLLLDLREGRAGRQVGGTDHATQ